MKYETVKLPGDVWEEYCRQCGVIADRSWFEAIRRYEEEVLSKR